MTPGVAIVGLGVGQAHAQTFAAAGRCRVRLLCDLDEGRARSVAASVGDGAAVATFEQILADDGISIVCLASFDQDHAAQVLRCLTAGKHVFVEKPLCQTSDELVAIREAWAKHAGRLKLASNLVLRAAPLYQWIRRSIARGELGDVYAFDGDYLYGRLGKIATGWRREVQDYSVMLGGGIHLVDLLLWTTGQRPIDAACSGNRLCSDGTAFRYDDYAAATLRAPSGLVARITANFGSVLRHQHVVRVFGTRATVIYDDAGARIHRARDRAAEPLDLDALPPSKGALVADFVRAVIDDGDLGSTTQEVFDAISVCLACDDARKTGTLREVRYV